MSADSSDVTKTIEEIQRLLADVDLRPTIDTKHLEDKPEDRVGKPAPKTEEQLAIENCQELKKRVDLLVASNPGAKITMPDEAWNHLQRKDGLRTPNSYFNQAVNEIFKYLPKRDIQESAMGASVAVPVGASSSSSASSSLHPSSSAGPSPRPVPIPVPTTKPGLATASSSSSSMSTDTKSDKEFASFGAMTSLPKPRANGVAQDHAKEKEDSPSQDSSESVEKPLGTHQFNQMRKKATEKFINISSLEAEARPMSAEEFIEKGRSIADEIKKTYGEGAIVKDNLDSKEKRSLTVEIILPDNKKDIMTQTYDDEKGCPVVTLTNPPDDVSIKIMLQASKDIVPLTMTNPCGAEVALRLYEASLISGVKVNLHEKDIATLKGDEKLAAHFEFLEKIAKDPAELEEFRKLVNRNPNRALGKPLEDKDKKQFKSLMPKTIELEGIPSAPKPPNLPRPS